MSRFRLAAAALLLSLSGSTLAAGPALPLPIPTLPGLALGQLGSFPALPGGGAVIPALPFAPPEGLVLILGNLTVAMGSSAPQLPLVGLLEAGDTNLRPIIEPLSNVVYIPVLGAAYGNN